LHRYPRNRLADDARAAVKAIEAAAAESEHAAKKAARTQRALNAGAGNVNVTAGAAGKANNDEPAESVTAASDRRSALPRVTGVRHWSTPDYTRVAIDVEQEVKFGSQRISHPDRIFFDLRDTKLASTLVGKTFDVDDGFLKKIRVAEFQPGRTRIVLEVDDLASYDAFLLPDPYRLIIDVHGKQIHGRQDRAALIAKAKADTALGSGPELGDDSSEPSSSVGGEVKLAERKAKKRSGDNGNADSGNAKDGAGPSKSGPVETDLPAEDVKPANDRRAMKTGATGTGVTKTTVAVKGSNRRIPKTIVDADPGADEDAADPTPATAASLEHEKLRRDQARDETADISGGDEAKSESRSSSGRSSSSTPPPLRRKNSRASTAGTVASDTPSLRADASDSDVRELPREARPNAVGDRSLTRALGLKIGKIVIDAGHGGHDTGTIGPNGLLEKDVVLDVAKRLGRLLESRLGADVIYTRQDDTFVPLETRTAIANRERADLFISIHANSSRDSEARGVETYYLNFTSSPEALEVAARENAVSEKSIHELQDLVKKIALKEKIEESREFAGDVQASLYGGLALNNAGIRDRGIKKAPFIVLIGANMPSILAEISFVSNPADERKMETSEHRQRIAESLYRGVSKYVNGLNGVKVASKIDKGEGQ
jgi:N-acetylmuramoyl-L-alanine amidase